MIMVIFMFNCQVVTAASGNPPGNNLFTHAAYSISILDIGKIQCIDCIQ